MMYAADLQEQRSIFLKKNLYFYYLYTAKQCMYIPAAILHQKP